jgi:excisionase family DNA binding protein
MREPEHYTTAEAAERLRIKPDSVAKKIKRGELAAIKVGKLWLIPKETLDAMLQPSSPRGE